MTIKQWKETSGAIFSPGDLRYLLKSLVGTAALSNDALDISDQQLVSLKAAEKRYAKEEPLAYILGKEEFFGREFKINPAVLVPRPDTEVICEKAIELAKKFHFRRALDLGTGNGVIAVTLAKEVGERLKVCACDISESAIEVAAENAANHEVEIEFFQSDLFRAMTGRKFELVVSNPPYVETSAIKGSLEYEPRLALDGGVDGLDVIRLILDQAKPYLKHGAYLILEIGYNQKETLDALLKGFSGYKIVEWIKDYGGNWRGIVLQKIEAE